MKRYSFFILCVLFGLLSASAAEPDELRGSVKDAETGAPVAGAIVKAGSSFTKTDREGHFLLKLKAMADSVSFRSMGYESLTLAASADMSEVCLNPKATLLNDVIVEAPDIYARGDTLVFNVERYANASDNAIIDVIKRLPGIKVKDDGTIEYQGKPINKFYIDGNDFIGGRYGLATNNISHKDVKAVEVMEKHQPVKALDGIEFPEEAGINLKLKEDARSRWVGVAQAAAGVEPFLWDGSVFTMRMASKMQNMFTFKADNTGWNPANEIRDHDFDSMFASGYAKSLWPEYISADMISAPLAEKRTRDNLSWLANAISAWKTGDTSMRLTLNYMGDRLDYKSGVRTDYFSEEIPTFVQDDAQRTQTHDFSAQFYSETNKRGYYLKDKLTLKGLIERSNSSITGSFDVAQRVDRKRFSAENDLKLVKRNDEKLFTLTSRNAFYHRPDRLRVNFSGSEGAVLSGSERAVLPGSEGAVLSGSERALQRVGSTDFRSTTETRFGKLKRFWKFYLTAGLDLDFHRIHTVLSGLGEADNEGTYPAFLSDLYVTPQADYERNGWRLSFYSPLKWYHYVVRGSHDYLSASPGVSVRKQLTSKSELLGSVGYYLGAPQPYLNIDAPFLEDYRNLFVACTPVYGCSGFGGGSYGWSGFGGGSYGWSGFGEGASDCGAVKSCRIDKYSNDVSASLSYRYRNPLRSLFVNLSASYRHSRSGIMSNQLFIEDFIVSTYAERVMNSDTWQVKGGMSKGLGHSKMVVGVEAEASTTSAASMRNNEVIGYRQGSVGVKPYFKGSIVRCLSVNYEAEYGASRLKMGGDRGVASLGKAVEETVYHTLRQNLFATFLPVDRVEFTVGGEHYFTRFPEGNTANLVLLDASAVWRINGRIRLSVTANNLLNQKIYSYVSYGTLSRSESRFQLRGRTILASLQFRF